MADACGTKIKDITLLGAVPKDACLIVETASGTRTVQAWDFFLAMLKCVPVKMDYGSIEGHTEPVWFAEKSNALGVPEGTLICDPTV